MKIYNFLSELLNLITFTKLTDLGQCLAPNCGCNIYLKTLEEDESCPENKWKMHLKIREERKNGTKK